MTVITGITTGIKIAKRLHRLGTKYKMIDPTNKFIQKYVPPGYRKYAFRVKEAADVILTGGVIYEIIKNYPSGKTTVRSPNNGKAGTDFYRAKSRRFSYSNSRYYNRCARPRKRYSV